MAKRSIRKRRHRYWSAFAAIMNRADAEFVSQAAAYERWFEAMGASMLGAIDDRNRVWWRDYAGVWSEEPWERDC